MIPLVGSIGRSASRSWRTVLRRTTHGRGILGDRVRSLVQFPRMRMPDLYRIAGAVVLRSLREMMPIALLEATASGEPYLVDPPLIHAPAPGSYHGKYVVSTSSSEIFPSPRSLEGQTAREAILSDCEAIARAQDCSEL